MIFQATLFPLISRYCSLLSKSCTTCARRASWNSPHGRRCRVDYVKRRRKMAGVTLIASEQPVFFFQVMLYHTGIHRVSHEWNWNQNSRVFLLNTLARNRFGGKWWWISTAVPYHSCTMSLIHSVHIFRLFSDLLGCWVDVGGKDAIPVCLAKYDQLGVTNHWHNM